MDILLIVDLQNGFTEKGNTNCLVKKVEELLKTGIFEWVIATKFANVRGGRYERFLNWRRLQTTYEQELRKEIVPYVNLIINKNTYNCVTEQFLDTLRKINGGTLPNCIYVVGVDTDCCVQTIAVSLFENDIRPIVLQQYCDSNGGEQSHNAGIITMQRTIGLAGIIPEEIRTKEQIEEISKLWS